MMMMMMMIMMMMIGYDEGELWAMRSTRENNEDGENEKDKKTKGG